MRNHGHLIVSLSRLGRWLAERAEAAGAMVLGEHRGRHAVGPGWPGGGRAHRGQGARPGRGAARQLRARQRYPCPPHRAGGGDPGAPDRGRLGPLRAEASTASLQTWELGVKEVWRGCPGRSVRSSIPSAWPLRVWRAGYRGARRFLPLLPWGPEHAAIGMVGGAGLPRRRPGRCGRPPPAKLKTHPTIRPLLAGGERLEWGPRPSPSGGYHAPPGPAASPRPLTAVATAPASLNIPTLKGIHYAIESGRLAAEAIFAALQHPEAEPAALAGYDRAVRNGFIGRDLHQTRDVRGPRAGLLPGWRSGGRADDPSRGAAPWPAKSPGSSDTHQPVLRTDRDRTYPVPDGRLTFDKLSSVYAAGQTTRDDQPNHIRVTRRVPAELADLWVHLCPAQVYSAGPARPGRYDRRPHRRLQLRPARRHLGSRAVGDSRPPKVGPGPGTPRPSQRVRRQMVRLNSSYTRTLYRTIPSGPASGRPTWRSGPGRTAAPRASSNAGTTCRRTHGWRWLARSWPRRRSQSRPNPQPRWQSRTGRRRFRR